MKQFNQFLNEFKQLNPKLPRSELEKRAKEFYKEEKKKYEETVNIIKVPSIEYIQKKNENKDIKPSKTHEELEQEKKEKEEEKIKEIRFNNIKKLVETWSIQLNKTIDGKPFPQFPINPITRRFVTPTDLYHIIDIMQKDEMIIELPALLTILLSDTNICINCYRAFIKDPIQASNKLAKFFHFKNIAFYPDLAVWQTPMMPQLRNEFINHSKGICKQFMQITINIDDELKDKIIASPLDSIYSLHDLIQIINKKPEILQKVSDNELQFYGINPDKAMEIRKIAGETKTKRDKALKKIIQDIIESKKPNEQNTERTKQNKKQPNKTKQIGGSSKHDLSLYASMLNI